MCGTVYAYNQMYPFIDPHLLVLACGIVFMSLKALFVFTSIIDPFSTPQTLSWKAITCLTPTPKELIKENCKIPENEDKESKKKQLTPASKQKSD